MSVSVETPLANASSPSTKEPPRPELPRQDSAPPANPLKKSPKHRSPQDDATATDFAGDVGVNNDLPTKAELDSVADLVVLAADGSSRPFRSLHSGEGVAKRVLVVFVRHFFCGNCQEFLRTLTQAVTSDSLLRLPEATFIAVIGCGRPELIPMYLEVTGCPFPVYADPSRKLYDLLGMTQTLNLGPKPDYIRRSFIGGTVASVIQTLRSGPDAFKGGDLRQVGGEFMFDEGKVVWCHRMRNTRDHAEIPELRRVLGFADVEGDTPAKEEVLAASSLSAPSPAATKRRSLAVGNVITRLGNDWGKKAGSVKTSNEVDSSKANREGAVVSAATAKTNGTPELKPAKVQSELEPAVEAPVAAADKTAPVPVPAALEKDEAKPTSPETAPAGVAYAPVGPNDKGEEKERVVEEREPVVEETKTNGATDLIATAHPTGQPEPDAVKT
ncbi:MAG: hypothetical protein M1832_002330 [Thelocarpon impressellum]|nr:MAG: hypothetical protein M1832_002330 [Thelocarpon impressellum]